MAKNFYETLGVSKSATDAEIKSAYRKLAMQYHPDRNKDNKEAEAKFKEINEAYEVLSNPQKKQAYDQYGDAAFGQGMGGPGGPFGGQQGPFTYTYSNGGQGFGGFDFGGGGTDPFEIFEQFFGGASPFGRRKPSYAIQIEFMEAVRGVDKKVTIDGKNQTIKIPAGIDDGTRIKFDNFDIVVRVSSDRRFPRQGSDIITEAEISMTQAALGDVIDVETVHGEVKLKIPEGTQPQALIRIKGKGMPHVKGKGMGDHYVRVKVKIPTKLSSKQKELLQEFDQNAKKGWF